MILIHCLQQLDLSLLLIGGQSRIAQVFDFGVTKFSRMSDRRCLMNRWQESASIIARSTVAAGRADRNKRWQIGVVRPEPVRNPGSDGRSNQVIAAGMQHRNCLAVRLASAVHRPNDAQVVDMPSGVRQQFRNPLTALAVPCEFPGRLQQLRRGINPGRFFKWQVFPVVSVE